MSDTMWESVPRPPTLPYYTSGEFSLQAITEKEINSYIQKYFYFRLAEKIHVRDVIFGKVSDTFDLRITLIVGYTTREQHDLMECCMPFEGAPRNKFNKGKVPTMYGLKYIKYEGSESSGRWSLKLNLNCFPKLKENFLTERAINALSGHTSN